MSRKELDLHARLLQVAAKTGSAPALITLRGRGRETLSFGDLASRSDSCAQWFEDQGLAAGDKVLVFIPMSAELYVLLFALWRLGAIAVFLDAWSGRERLERAVADAAPKAMVAGPLALFAAQFSKVFRRIPLKVPLGGPWSLQSSVPGSEASRARTPEMDRTALVTYTTGSTGSPKPAFRSHRQLWAQHLALRKTMHGPMGSLDLPTLPIFVLHNLAQGRPSLLPGLDPRRPGRCDAKGLLRAIQDEGVQSASGSPALFLRLAAEAKRQGLKLPFRKLHVGGAPVLPEQAAELQAAVAGDVRVVYGSSEAEPMAEVGASELARSGGPGLLAGVPVGATLRIVDPDDPQARPLPPGREGEILVRGPHVCCTVPRQDWHATGDGGFLDKDGKLQLLGRVGSRVKVGDSWVWALPLELAARRDPGVAFAALARTETRAALFVEPRRWSQRKDIQRRLLEEMPSLANIGLILMGKIPRDKRHQSKADLEGLRSLLAQR